MSEGRRTVVHLAASPFFGGPERQMLGLAQALPETYRVVFLSFPERGLAQALLERVRQAGFEGFALAQNTPHLVRAAREVAGYLRRERADILLCHGYKPDIVGVLAGRLARIPVVCVAHGWTAASWKVRAYELVDRLAMRWASATVCVSAAMAARVRAAGVPARKLAVIRNAIDPAAFAEPEPAYRERLGELFAVRPARIVAAVGRLSPEKGFAQLIEAAVLVRRQHPDAGFVLFGEGPLRSSLEELVRARGLQECFALAGFRTDVERFLPHFDMLVNSSFTEGLPVVVLEALCSGVPVVATAVGGTPEVVSEGVHGFLVPPGDPAALARRISELLNDETRRREMGQRGRLRAREEFSFATQAMLYQRLFERLMPPHRDPPPPGTSWGGGKLLADSVASPLSKGALLR